MLRRLVKSARKTTTQTSSLKVEHLLGFSGPVEPSYGRPKAEFSTSSAPLLHASSLCIEHSLIQEGDELSFAWLTPRSLIKGLEGGILARLLATPRIKLAGARMFSPSDAFVDEYIAIHRRTYKPMPFSPFVDFIEKNLRPSVIETQHMPNHLLFLLFSGKNVRAELSKVIGDYLPDPRVGMVGRTIRGAYGDFIRDASGSITHFQPAIVSASSDEANKQYLRLFAKYLDTQGGTFDTFYDTLSAHTDYQTGMVMIKPDMLERPSSLPGHIMDLFGSTGLHLVGCRVFSFSVKQAQAFYGFLEDVFVDKLRPNLEKRIRSALEKEFDGKLAITAADYDLMTTILKRKAAKAEVDNIIHYMTGVHPSKLETEAQRMQPGPARCLALLYRGQNAIETIRNKLGSTDPSKAAVGTIRSDYGRDIMKNGAHASDSEASLARERAIIGLVPGAPSMTRRTIEAWLEMQEGKAPRGGSSGGVRLSSHVANPKDQQYAYDEVAQHSYYY